MRYNRRGKYSSSSYRGPSSINYEQEPQGRAANNEQQPTGSPATGASATFATGETYGQPAPGYGRGGSRFGGSRYAGVHKPSYYGGQQRYYDNNGRKTYAGSQYTQNAFTQESTQPSWSAAGHAEPEQQYTGSEYSADPVSRPASAKPAPSASASPVPPPSRSRFQNTTAQQHQHNAANTGSLSSPAHHPQHGGLSSWKRGPNRFGRPSTPLMERAQVSVESGASSYPYHSHASRCSTSSPRVAPTAAPAGSASNAAATSHEHFYAEYTKQLATAVVSEHDLKKASSLKNQIRDIYKDYDSINERARQNQFDRMFKTLEVKQSQVNYESLKLMNELNQECLDMILLQG
ncbi:hypothetical protein ACO0RG_002737 [Hanseniaspora osmophila]